MTKFSLAVFDMDGLIFNSERAFMEELKGVLAEKGYTLTEEIYKSTLGLRGEKLKEVMCSHFGEDYPVVDMSRKARERVNKRASEGKLEVKKGIPELLEFLTDNGIVCTIASSSSYGYVDSYIKAAGLRKYFSTITGGDEITVSKPEPDIFIAACKKEGFSTDEAIVFEDSPNGVLAALRAGIYTVCIPDMAVPDNELVQKAGIMVKDVFEAKKVIEEILNGEKRDKN